MRGAREAIRKDNDPIPTATAAAKLKLLGMMYKVATNPIKASL